MNPIDRKYLRNRAGIPGDVIVAAWKEAYGEERVSARIDRIRALAAMTGRRLFARPSESRKGQCANARAPP